MSKNETARLTIIEDRIFIIRNLQVMIDKDLADLYAVETKVLNQAVKRNIDKFPEDFRFQLTTEKKRELVTNCDRFESLKHSSLQSPILGNHNSVSNKTHQAARRGGFFLFMEQFLTHIPDRRIFF